MKQSVMLLALLASLPWLQSCESTPKPYNQWHTEPLLRISQAQSADNYYQLGRYYLGQGRNDKATAALRKVLTLDAGHAEAHNALGTLHARQGQYPAAEAAFQHALTLAPERAHFHNNLGYVRYLQGQYAAAAQSFEHAVRLAPDSARSLNNLAMARLKLGQPQQAYPAFAQAERVPAPMPPDGEALALPKDSGVIGRAAPLALPAASPHGPGDRMPGPRTVAAVPTATTDAAGYRLEVANGNGVAGLARQVGILLRGHGYPPARLSNRQPYRQATTVIEYRSGYDRQARQLGDALPLRPTLSPQPMAPQDGDVRLVLGRDARDPASLMPQRILLAAR